MKKLMKTKEKETLLFLAALFLGVGMGMILGNTGAGTVIGMGVGFLAAFIYSIRKKK